jgi:hypothetical protein
VDNLVSFVCFCVAGVVDCLPWGLQIYPAFLHCASGEHPKFFCFKKRRCSSRPITRRHLNLASRSTWATTSALRTLLNSRLTPAAAVDGRVFDMGGIHKLDRKKSACAHCLGGSRVRWAGKNGVMASARLQRVTMADGSFWVLLLQGGRVIEIAPFTTASQLICPMNK